MEIFDINVTYVVLFFVAFCFIIWFIFFRTKSSGSSYNIKTLSDSRRNDNSSLNSFSDDFYVSSSRGSYHSNNDHCGGSSDTCSSSSD